MVPILSAFGLFRGPAPLAHPRAELTSQSKFRNARFMPFLSQAHFQRFTCTAPDALGRDYLRVQVNQQTQAALNQSWCPVDDLRTLSSEEQTLLKQGLCPLDTVLAALEWTLGDAEWRKCSEKQF